MPLEELPPDERSISFDQTLAARGVPSQHDLALDETITPRALERSATTAAAAAPARTPLPSVSLSFPEGEGRISLPAEDRELDVISLLGAGGMGSVYLARQRSLDREVAVKTTHVAGSTQSAAALCEEAVITGHLEHPGVVPIHQLARGPDGRPVLVMKRIEGTSWRELLRDDTHPAWSRMRVRSDDRRAFHLEVLGRVCEALAFAHSRGIVHRDVKPENVMVGAFGEVYLVDWGLAVRVGQQREGEPLVGTPVYMAPEMVRGGAIDARTDVYLLGATLYELLTGAPPHRGENLHQVLLAAMESEPAPLGPEVPSDLAELCRRAMARDPDARPKDAGEVRDALADHDRHRASRALSARADERLSELRARMAEEAREAALPALYRLVAECRFGYLEAQREWAENEAVAPGLQATLGAAVEIEIGRRDPVAARALLAELPAPDASLEARVVELERERERERAEAARLQQLAEGTDSTAQPKLRLALVALGITLAVAVSVLASRQAASTEGVTVADTFRFSLMTSGLVIVGLATLGRRLWSHAFNRRFAGWAMISSASLIVNRAIGLASGIEVRTLLTHDLVLLAVCFAFGALIAFPLLWIATAIMLVGAVLIDAFPELAPTVFSTSGVASMIVIGIALARARRRASADTRET